MKLTELATFSVLHRDLPWPWIAFSTNADRFAALVTSDRIASWTLEGDVVKEGPSFSLPADLAPVLRGFALASSGEQLAAFSDEAIFTIGIEGVVRQTRLDAIGGEGFRARAVLFDRRGTRIWISAESKTEAAFFLLDANTHQGPTSLRSEAFPEATVHELHSHPVDDAVLLLAACGQEGTFARVAGFSDGPIERVETELDHGGISAGFVGFSRDGMLVHLAEADELRTHAWPGLHQLSSVELEGEFVSSFTGAVLGHWVFVDGEDTDTNEDSVMQFERSAIRGARLEPPFPQGMWAGRLGEDCIVTVDAKGDPSPARVIRMPVPLASSSAS